MPPFDSIDDDEPEHGVPPNSAFLEDWIAAGVCPECHGRLVYHGDGYHCAGCGWDEDDDDGGGGDPGGAA